MIRYRSDGQFFHLGLNVSRARSGFVVAWVWYDVERYELTLRRFRVRLHMWPWFLWTTSRENVIDDYLAVNSLALVSDSVLEDAAAIKAKPHELEADQS